MLELTFTFGTDLVRLRVEANREVTFWTVVRGVPMYSTIEGLKLSISGIIKEFPDLKGKPIPEMRAEAIKRFREKMRSLQTVDDIKNYLQGQLEPHGYKLILVQRKGFRPEKP